MHLPSACTASALFLAWEDKWTGSKQYLFSSWPLLPACCCGNVSGADNPLPPEDAPARAVVLPGRVHKNNFTLESQSEKVQLSLQTKRSRQAQRFVLGSCSLWSTLAIPLSLLAGTVVAQVESTTTVGSYGELHYNEPDGTRKGQIDFHRFVIYLGHTFSEQLSFGSEIELEHTIIEAGESEGGELSIEQAFLDYRFANSIGLRVGILLPPVGLINLHHEPPTFHGVERPSVDRVIIPTTWRESGAGIYGNFRNDFAYQLYVVAGLDASGFTVGNGLRGGRQKAFQSNSTNPSVTGRLDYSPVAGLQLGGSFFLGGSSAGNDSIGTAFVTLWSGDVRFNADPFTFRAVGASGTIGDAELINAQFGQTVASSFFGYYVEGAYNLLHWMAPESEHVLDLFVRFEKYNTQASTTGFDPLNQYNRHDVVLGLTYKPTYNTAFKFDYTFLNNALDSAASPNTGQLNLGMGFYFF